MSFGASQAHEPRALSWCLGKKKKVQPVRTVLHVLCRRNVILLEERAVSHRARLPPLLCVSVCLFLKSVYTDATALIRTLSAPTVKEEVDAYEIVTPVRVNEAGDKFPTSVHFKRKRRSVADESAGNATDHWASSNIHYRISAFGRSFHLNLSLDSGFIAPLYTVTVLGVPRGDNITDFAGDEVEVEEAEEEEDTELRHCFYKGHVNAQGEHAAVISLCSGLVSFYARLESPCMRWCFFFSFFPLFYDGVLHFPTRSKLESLLLNMG